MGEGVFEKKRKEEETLAQVGGVGGVELAKRVGVGDRVRLGPSSGHGSEPACCVI